MAGEQPARSVGRPRDEDLSRRILDSTRRHLRDEGFSAFRVNDVAAELGCGVSTIYRRWSTREHLMADAIATRPQISFEPTGDAIEDLRTVVTLVINDLALSPTVLSAAMELVQGDSDVADAIRSMLRPTREMLLSHVDAVIGDHPSRSLIVDTIPGNILFRSVLMGEPITGEGVADEVVDLVVALAS